MRDDDGRSARFMINREVWGEAGRTHSTFGTVLMVCAGVVLLAGFLRRPVLPAAVVMAVGFAVLGWWQLGKGQQLTEQNPGDQQLVLETDAAGLRLPGSTERLPWDWVRDVTVHRGFGPHLRLRIVPHAEHPEFPAEARPAARVRRTEVVLSPEHFNVGLEELVSAFAPHVPIHDPDGPYRGT